MSLSALSGIAALSSIADGTGGGGGGGDDTLALLTESGEQIMTEDGQVIDVDT